MYLPGGFQVSNTKILERLKIQYRKERTDQLTNSQQAVHLPSTRKVCTPCLKWMRADEYVLSARSFKLSSWYDAVEGLEGVDKNFYLVEHPVSFGKQELSM